MHIAIVGAGAGGLAASIQLRRAGHEVTLLEAAPQPGGLAARVCFDGVNFDGGPYILLDKPGLHWVFEQLRVRVEDHLELIRLDHPWRVTWADGAHLDVFDDLDRTCDGFEAHRSGAGTKYRTFVHQMAKMYDTLAPLQRRTRPKPWNMLTPSRIHAVPFMLRPLDTHLQATGLPQTVIDTMAIWTQISGQSFKKAPAVMSLVPAIVHNHGAWVVRGGMARIIDVLAKLATDLGVVLRCNTPVQRITTHKGSVTGVETPQGHIQADTVVANAAALSVLFELLDAPIPSHEKRWAHLPLQSPGVGIYLTADAGDVPFLTFRREGQRCEARVVHGVADPDQPQQVRLITPIDHGQPEASAADKIERLVNASWWQDELDNITVRGTRTPADFGAAAHLYRDSMNPVMTQAFMRQGRIPHHIRELKGLYLAGSATHPGQWVTFCAISGILAAGYISPR